MINDQEISDNPNIHQKHSKMGVASFIISLVQGGINVIAVISAGVLTTLGPQDEHEIGFMIIGLVIFGGIFAHLTGVGLGIAGIVQRNTKKVLSILGLIFNLGAILVVLMLMIMGMAATQ